MIISEVFNNVKDFQEAERLRYEKIQAWWEEKTKVDYFIWQDVKYWTLWKEYWNDLVYLKDRLLFYYMTKPNVLQNEDARLWFAMGLNLFLDLMSKNEKDLTNKRKDDIIKPVEENPKKKPIKRIY